MVPSICKLFTANDRSIRRSLLENIDVFGDKFDSATIEDKVRTMPESRVASRAAPCTLPGCASIPSSRSEIRHTTHGQAFNGRH